MQMVPQGKPPASAHDRREKKKAKLTTVVKPQKQKAFKDTCYIVISTPVSFPKLCWVSSKLMSREEARQDGDKDGKKSSCGAAFWGLKCITFTLAQHGKELASGL